jgi:hypothetical protein
MVPFELFKDTDHSQTGPFSVSPRRRFTIVMFPARSIVRKIDTPYRTDRSFRNRLHVREPERKPLIALLKRLYELIPVIDEPLFALPERDTNAARGESPLR